jgi:sialic acid synthase SpsE
MFRFKDYFKNRSTLIIAEFANAFEGKKEIALKMIDAAIDAGVDALKFQLFFTDELLVPEHPKYDIFKGLETKRNDWQNILNYARKTETFIFVDVFGEESFEFSKNFEVDAYKIPPSDMKNLGLINRVCESGISTILSAGASTIDDLGYILDICKKNGLQDYAIMYGFQSYPTKLEETNLNLIMTLENKFHCPVGYADHVDGGSEFALLMPLLAVAKGARLIEKHFTLKREKKETDYQSSVNPKVLKKIVLKVKSLDLIFGSSYKKLSQDENRYKRDVAKRVVARRKIKSGERLFEKDLALKRAPHGIFANDMEKFLGRITRKDLEKNQALEWDDIKRD